MQPRGEPIRKRTPSTATLNADSTKINLITSGIAIAHGDVVTIKYMAGDVLAADGGVLASFSGQAVTNNVLAYPVDLTILSTAGGNVAALGEGTFIYEEGEVVSLVAVADADYRFVEWTASAGVFSNATAAENTFIMPTHNVTVTANFAKVSVPPVYPTVTTHAAAGVLA